jgi:tetratricopeptide (TPR) repeat protein
MSGKSGYTWMFAGACVLALAVLVSVYSNSLGNALHFDDKYVVEGNLYIRSLNIPLFFRDASTGTSLPANAVYRPLVTTSLALDYRLAGGLNVRQFHLSQITMFVFLAVAVMFLYLELMKLAADRWWNRWVAFAAAMLYALHTTNTETLNLMHARSELISGLGVVGSFLVYFHLPRSRRTYLYLLPMAVGALAKSPAVMFAPLFLVYVFLFEQGLSLSDLFSRQCWPGLRAAIWKSLPAFIVGLLVFVGIGAMDAPTVNYGGGSRYEYLLTQTFVWGHYVRLFFLPIGLTADTDWRLITSWYDTRVIAGCLFLVLLFRLLWTTSKSAAWRPVTFGLAWFALALLPTSSIVPLAEVSNEHRVFFPYIGLTLAVVWGLTQLAVRWSELRPRLQPLVTSAALVLVLVAISGNAVGTYERNKIWATEESLWRDVSEKSPANGRGLMNYGVTLMAQARFEEARRLFEQALAYNPNYAPLQINLGIVIDRLGQPVLAESYFQKALQLGPNEPTPHFFYGRWLVERGRPGEAIPHLERAIALSPGDASTRYLLLETYAKVGSTGALKSLAVESLALLPGDPKIKQYLNDRGEAVVPQPPPVTDTPESLLNASLRFYQTGDFQNSLDTARKALALRPDYAEAYNNIAAAYASMKKWDEAIEAAREALRLKPDFPLAKNNLAWAESEKSKLSK